MSRTFTVKTIGGKSEEMVAEETETLDEFREKIRSEFGIDDDRTIKLMYNSSIVNNDHGFSVIPDRSAIVCLATRPPRPVQPQVQPEVQPQDKPLLPPNWENQESQTKRASTT